MPGKRQEQLQDIETLGDHQTKSKCLLRIGKAEQVATSNQPTSFLNICTNRPGTSI